MLIVHLLGREAVGSWIQVTALPHDSCVILGQLIHLSGLQFLLLQMGNDNVCSVLVIIKSDI